MLLRDMYCTVCGLVAFDVDSSPEAKLPCTNCGCFTPHMSICNGGVKKRFRCNDWPDSRTDPDFYHGQMTSTIGAFTVDDKGIEHPVEYTPAAGSGVIHEQGKFAGDGEAERRDRLHHERKAKVGKNPIFVDVKHA